MRPWLLITLSLLTATVVNLQASRHIGDYSRLDALTTVGNFSNTVGENGDFRPLHRKSFRKRRAGLSATAGLSCYTQA